MNNRDRSRHYTPAVNSRLTDKVTEKSGNGAGISLRRVNQYLIAQSHVLLAGPQARELRGSIRGKHIPGFAVATDIDTQYLLDLARDKSTDGRTRLIEIVGDLFFDGDNVLKAEERDLMTDILRRLIHDVEKSVRKAIADRLSETTGAPPELVTILANDDIEVAHGILRRSDVLQDLELIEIIQHRTMEHQLAIAMRRNVSEAVSDALVETRNTAVIGTLIENETAEISANTMEYLVNESKTNKAFQTPLLNRPDLGDKLAKRMYWWVSAALRQHIVTNYRIDPTTLDQNIEGTIKDMLGGDAGRNAVGTIDPEPVERADALAARVAEGNAITPQLLLQTLRKG